MQGVLLVLCTDRSGELGFAEIGVTHEEFIYFVGTTAAFGDGPDNKGLTAVHVTGGEDAWDVGGKGVLVFGLNCASGV